MPQPALGVWFSGPLPTSAICFIALNKSLSPSLTGIKFFRWSVELMILGYGEKGNK